MQPKKRDLKDEARERFKLFIAGRLDTQNCVNSTNLAQEFFDQEKTILRKLADHSLLRMLVKWADDILNNSMASKAEREARPQLVLPFSLQGIEVPCAFSFVTDADEVAFVADYKVVWWQMESHGYLLRKHAEESKIASKKFDKLMASVQPLMEADPKMTLFEALRRLADGDKGAA